VRLVRICALLLIIAVSCSAEGTDSIAVGLRGNNQPFAIVDNCPSVQDVTLSANGTQVWALTRTSAAPDTATVDVPLGVPAEGWQELTPLEGGFREGVQYVVAVGPDETSLEFSLTDLALGQVYDGQSLSPTGTRSDFETCDDVDSGGIDDFGDFLFTAGVLLILAFGVIGIVAWLLVKGLQRLVDRRAGGRLADEPPDEQWVERD